MITFLLLYFEESDPIRRRVPVPARLISTLIHDGKHARFGSNFPVASNLRRRLHVRALQDMTSYKLQQKFVQIVSSHEYVLHNISGNPMNGSGGNY